MSWACDFEGPKVYDEVERVARKDHTCIECDAPILKGERHLYYKGLWDGNWSSGRQHLLCRDACVWIRDVLGEGCVGFGGLHEWWAESRSPAAIMPRYFVTSRGSLLTFRYWWEKNWRIGAKMYAMIRRRERLAKMD